MRYFMALLLLSCLQAQGQNVSNFIHVDQFGYLPNAQKIAVLSNPQLGFNAGDSYAPSESLELRNAGSDAVVLTIEPTIWNTGATHDQSGDKGWWLDFSELDTPGTYYLIDVANGEQSATFEIGPQVYNEVLKTAGRMFYYNRCSAAHPATFAGDDWADGFAFAQDSQARSISDPNNAALEKDLSGGWWDAGDNNKYVTFASSAVHNLLSAYQENPQVFGDDWNIPESGNGSADVLDEIKWELDWLLKMCNEDGTVHIKMGNQNYAENGDSPPSLNTDARFYGPTCTSAAIAAAGMLAHAAIVYAQEDGFEAYAAILQTQAELCWQSVAAILPTGNLEIDCDDGSITAGDADRSVDEQMEEAVAASAFLYGLTQNQVYETFFLSNYQNTETIDINLWNQYGTQLHDAMLYYAGLASANGAAANLIRNSAALAAQNNYEGLFGDSDADLYQAYIPGYSYHWGSNSPKASLGVLQNIFAYNNLNPASASDYTSRAQRHLSYFHGVNPLGIVYLSNMYDFGAEKCVNEIYHFWFWDGTEYDHALNSEIGPAPGFLVGGPNASFSNANLSPPSAQPAQKSYLDFNDDWPNVSYEISEPAIYYQAAYFRLLAAFSAELVPSCREDVNEDGVINTADLLFVVGDLGTACPQVCAGDVNGDNLVSTLDIVNVVSLLGTDCE